jgi:hypothetical protein
MASTSFEMASTNYALSLDQMTKLAFNLSITSEQEISTELFLAVTL